MSKDNVAATPREIANIAEATVVTLPQRVLSLLLSLALREGNAPTDQEQVRERGGISDTIDYLGTKFSSDFAAAAGGMEDTLTETTEALCSSLKLVHSKLPEDPKNLSTDQLHDLKAHVNGSLAPAVSAFLSALFDGVVGFEKASAKLAKDVDSSALGQIDEISRKISFIAINASVEAARVGDAGRGFGVIAAEIKELSERSRAAVERVRASSL